MAPFRFLAVRCRRRAAPGPDHRRHLPTDHFLRCAPMITNPMQQLVRSERMGGMSRLKAPGGVPGESAVLEATSSMMTLPTPASLPRKGDGSAPRFDNRPCMVV